MQEAYLFPLSLVLWPVAAVQVAAGAAKEYQQALGGIASLSAAGAGQAAVDAEYFCNVLSALGVPLPPALATWQVWIS